MLLILTAISFNACEKDEAEKQTTPDPTPQLSQTGADVWKNANSNLLHFKNQQVFDSVVEAHENFTHADFAAWENSLSFHSMRAEHQLWATDTTQATQFEAWIPDIFLRSVLNLDGKVVVGDTTYQISEANYYKKFVNGSEIFSKPNAIITISDSSTEEESSVIIRDDDLQYIWERGEGGSTSGTVQKNKASSTCCPWYIPANSPYIGWTEPNNFNGNQGVVKEYTMDVKSDKRIQCEIFNMVFDDFYQVARMRMWVEVKRGWWIFRGWKLRGSAPFMAVWYNGWLSSPTCSNTWCPYQRVYSEWNKSEIWKTLPNSYSNNVLANGWYMFEYNGDNQNWTDFHAEADTW